MRLGQDADGDGSEGVARRLWADPVNWGRGPLAVHFDRSDPRLLGPKRIPALGYTLNMAHPAAAPLAAAGFAAALALAYRLGKLRGRAG